VRKLPTIAQNQPDATSGSSAIESLLLRALFSHLILRGDPASWHSRQLHCHLWHQSQRAVNNGCAVFFFISSQHRPLTQPLGSGSPPDLPPSQDARLVPCAARHRPPSCSASPTSGQSPSHGFSLARISIPACTCRFHARKESHHCAPPSSSSR